MNFSAIPPISQVSEKEGRRQGAPVAKEIDLKVQDLISLRVQLPRTKEGSLLATAVDPSEQMVRRSGDWHPVEWEPRKKKKTLRTIQGSYLPIGLKRCDAYPWINAFMQFLLFLPTFREVLSYVPKSLLGVREFADRYMCDLEAKKSVSGAEGFYAAGSLLNKFPHLFQEGEGVANLDEAVQMIWKSASSFSPERPVWQILWDSNEGIEKLFAEEQMASGFEWLIGLRQLYERSAKSNPEVLFRGNFLERQYVVNRSFCMELDAFIEVRPDKGHKASYFAYVKAGGTWVQCSDEKILVLRGSRSLEMPLQRGVLFHFRRVPLN